MGTGVAVTGVGAVAKTVTISEDSMRNSACCCGNCDSFDKSWHKGSGFKGSHCKGPRWKVMLWMIGCAVPIRPRPPCAALHHPVHPMPLHSLAILHAVLDAVSD